MSFNIPNEALQSTFERGWDFVNRCKEPWNRDLRKEHKSFLLRHKASGIVDHDRDCDKVQKRLDGIWKHT